MAASRARWLVTASRTGRGGKAEPALLKWRTLATPGVSDLSNGTSSVIGLIFRWTPQDRPVVDGSKPALIRQQYPNKSQRAVRACGGSIARCALAISSSSAMGSLVDGLGRLALSGIAVSAASRALGPPLGWIAGHGAHVRGNGELQELQVSRCRRLVVPKAARDVERLARLDTQLLAVLELQVNPSTEHVHELTLADVVVPPRRLRHPLGPDGDLGADLPAARGRDAEVAVLEEGAPACHQGGSGRRRVRQLARGVHGGRLSDRRARVVHHGASSEFVPRYYPIHAQSEAVSRQEPPWARR